MVLCERCRREVRSETRSAFAQAMRDARDASGLTQKAAAARIDISVSMILRIESGQSVGSRPVVQLLLVEYKTDKQTVESIIALYKEEKARRREEKK